MSARREPLDASRAFDRVIRRGLNEESARLGVDVDAEILNLSEIPFLLAVHSNGHIEVSCDEAFTPDIPGLLRHLADVVEHSAPTEGAH